MKVITELQKPPMLLLYEALSKRKSLLTKERSTYHTLRKGYEGELIFSNIIRKLRGDGLIFNDLLLESNQSTFQIDCLLINQSRIYLFEVKNFEGEFYLESDKLYKKPRNEILNPLHQLSRAESLLRQLLLNLGFNTPIDASVVFVNPAFTLYQAPVDIPVIFPNQINRHLKVISNQSSNLTTNMERLATKLLEVRKTDYPFYDKPAYEYRELEKGLVCPACERLTVRLLKRSCICEECGHKEPMKKAILRAVKEFQLLFPERKITTNEIYDWCKTIESKRAIHRVLSTNYQVIGSKRWTYFK